MRRIRSRHQAAEDMCPWLALPINPLPSTTKPADRRGANHKARCAPAHRAGPRALLRPQRIQPVMRSKTAYHQAPAMDGGRGFFFISLIFRFDHFLTFFLFFYILIIFVFHYDIIAYILLFFLLFHYLF